jgi:hypothetical protein
MKAQFDLRKARRITPARSGAGPREVSFQIGASLTVSIVQTKRTEGLIHALASINTLVDDARSREAILLGLLAQHLTLPGKKPSARRKAS